VNETEAAAWMRRLALASAEESDLPDPALIWWRAQLLERRAARARVTFPISIAQWASVVVPAVTFFTLTVSHWQEISSLIARFVSRG
jgi:hypothetical protein